MRRLAAGPESQPRRWTARPRRTGRTRTGC
jgi:hypothetical protein